MKCQPVRIALVEMIFKLATEAREAETEAQAVAADHQAFGATLLAYQAGSIDHSTYTALCNLAGNARLLRCIEIVYDQPPYSRALVVHYTGPVFGKTRRNAAEQVAA